MCVLRRKIGAQTGYTDRPLVSVRPTRHRIPATWEHYKYEYMYKYIFFLTKQHVFVGFLLIFANIHLELY